MTGKVFDYIWKNILYIFPFTLICGILLAGMLDYNALSSVASNVLSGNIGSVDFFTLFRALSILNFSSWYYFLFSLASVFGIGVALAMELAFVEKHMRIGKRTLNGLWGKINDNFLSTFIQILIYLVIYEVWALLTCAISFAFISIFRSVVVAQYVFAFGFMILFTYVLLYVVHLFYLWLPCAEITGFTFYESLKYSTQLVGKVRRELLLSYIVGIFLSGVIFFGVTALDTLFMHAPVVVYITAAVLCVILFTFFTIGQEVVYFETDQLERADLPRVY